jgi:putative nucleotidyltransferase with HDIG domain
MKTPPHFLELLIYIIGIYDPYGNNHSERVTRLAVLLARRSGIKDDTQEMMDIELGCLLHDIGKIGIPESIRRMPGRYTMPERLIMEQHTTIGMEFLLKVPNGGLSQNMKLIVKHHHEDWNGQGYPDGLKGEAIPLGARVLRIPDTYDALTHERGYQRAYSKSEAIQIMVDEQIKNPWADPDLFRLFLEIVK